MPLTTRFAPSPSGYLHLGHIASALYVWGIAKVLKASVILRIEDHDKQRSKEIYRKAILDDLEWLGFASSISMLSIQSNNHERYIKSLQDLDNQGLIYGCTCSRKKISEQQSLKTSELYYPGFCRSNNISFNDPKTKTIRFHISKTPVTFKDENLGEITHDVKHQCGDFSLKDANGNFTYHFSNVVDDLVEKVDLVIRGEDILSSTGRQINLHEALSNNIKVKFFHHPLVYQKGSSINKLSKRDGSTGIVDLKRGGQSVGEVLGSAAFLVGLNPKKLILNNDAAMSLVSSYLEPKLKNMF